MLLYVSRERVCFVRCYAEIIEHIEREKNSSPQQILLSGYVLSRSVEFMGVNLVQMLTVSKVK